MRVLKLIIIAVTIFLGASAIFEKSPLHLKHEISDWFSRLGTPNFIVALDSFTSTDQSETIREYKNRGHELNCYGNLRREEKIGSATDYLCYAYINSAYDNIPARLVTFFFSESRLTHIRIEFPGSSFAKLHDFLNRYLAKYQRLDLLPQYDFGPDNFGNPLMVWKVKKGIVTTSAVHSEGQHAVLLWSNIGS